MDLFDYATSGPAQPPSSLGTSQFDEPLIAARAPVGLIALLGLEIVACLICFIPGTKLFHIVGYVMGAVLVSLTAVAFRSTDRLRRRSSAYVTSPWCKYAVAGALVAGVGLAALHAYYFAQTKHLVS